MLRRLLRAHHPVCRGILRSQAIIHVQQRRLSGPAPSVTTLDVLKASTESTVEMVSEDTLVRFRVALGATYCQLSRECTFARFSMRCN